MNEFPTSIEAPQPAEEGLTAVLESPEAAAAPAQETVPAEQPRLSREEVADFLNEVEVSDGPALSLAEQWAAQKAGQESTQTAASIPEQVAAETPAIMPAELAAVGTPEAADASTKFGYSDAAAEQYLAEHHIRMNDGTWELSFDINNDGVISDQEHVWSLPHLADYPQNVVRIDDGNIVIDSFDIEHNLVASIGFTPTGDQLERVSV